LTVLPLRSASTRALQTILNDQPVSAAKVKFAWQIAAGPAMARATTPAWSGDGVLRVRARDAAWRVEVSRARPIIAQRLEPLLGPGVVQKIVIEK
jgi:Dna[CI] antecedent, DciA